ncbi:MAG TPA: adenosyl-hopene transferase HpnH [Nitrospirota bacterium]|nr:adenosyl-hopene transferase HpnH [Nitrospirota bacterium]
MRFPMQLNVSLTKYMAGKRLSGQGRFPLVLMLEPLHLCNLSCTGCGRIREYADTLQEMMTPEECLSAVKECGAPVVSICGGEPLIYPHIGRIVREILALRKHIHLCTNAVRLAEMLPQFKPSPYFSFDVSIDGLEQTQEKTRGRKGIYKLQMDAIREAKARNFRVITNTTLYKETDVREVEELFDRLTMLGVDGMLVTPGFSYEAVKEDIFLDREASREKFRYIASLAPKYRFFNTPLYMRFLAGERQLKCTPWGTVTVNPRGWKAPCYLITDAHYKSFGELMGGTDWERFIERADPRCRDCMVHSGVEATAVQEAGKSLKDMVELIRWNLS